MSHLNKPMLPPGGCFDIAVIVGRIISAPSNGWYSPKSIIDSMRDCSDRNFLSGPPELLRTHLGL